MNVAFGPGKDISAWEGRQAQFSSSVLWNRVLGGTAKRRPGRRVNWRLPEGLPEGLLSGEAIGSSSEEKGEPIVIGLSCASAQRWTSKP